MKIPFIVCPGQVLEPASALLLPSTQAEDLFKLLASLRLECFPEVFATAEGFLIKLPQRCDGAAVGAVRLRQLTNNLFLPVDATLLPPLLDDEARGLVRERGLIFLPGGRILEFVLQKPLPLNELLRLKSPCVVDWQRLPEPPALAEELLEIVSLAPRPGADEILEAGRQDIGSESPKPRGDTGIGSKIAGHAAYAVGKSLAWLGTKLSLARWPAPAPTCCSARLLRSPRSAND